MLVVAAATASGATIYLIQASPPMCEQQHITREKFFGTAEAMPPGAKGQEMRPRW
ncbi:entry exclusion protein TrbK [Rhizobium rhizoryzae]|uniref:entry exclusion protein TrbK n=1 Tax=Rhizobium rhizoryzae TaxID=451876 RepID=UPI00289CD3A2|nr:entry exclusion protein TrbK [Rhizobium rhizoryzae]